MIPNLPLIRNRLLSGWERHPWDHHYQVCRKDVVPGLKITANLYTLVANGVPVIKSDSEMKDALKDPSKYKWTAKKHVSVGTVEMKRLMLTSLPYCKDDHWYATAVDEATGEESHYLLFALGIVPDYLLVPKRDDIFPAGWNPDAKSYFNR